MGQGGFTRLLNHFLGAGQFVPDAVLLETVRMEIIAHGFSHILSSFLQRFLERELGDETSGCF